jgi:dTMP kinase
VGCILTRGRFITLEGGEGAGKTTQQTLLAERLRSAGIEVLVTREPGGTPGAEAIRALLVEGGTDRWAASTELLLLTAARDDHVRRVIEPALGRGIWVICDRFLDSTRVYQGLAGGLGVTMVDRLHDLMLGGFGPELTLLLDLAPEIGLSRRGDLASGQRFERKGIDFHSRVRQGFRELADREPARFAVIDATAPVDAVAESVWAELFRRLPVSR